MGTEKPLPTLTWIVCHGRTLRVSDNMIDCPLRGRVAPDLCVTCHFLETVEAERDDRLACNLEPLRITAPRSREVGSSVAAETEDVVTDLIGAF
jgi:hypothetical protein